jgi:hypothetical protein
VTEHLGHEKNGSVINETGNARDGSRPKMVLTESTGQVHVEVPRDRDGSFEPQIVKKRHRRLTGVEENVLSLYAKGLTTGEICAHFVEIYGASMSKATVSRITGKVIEEIQSWQARPLDQAQAKRLERVQRPLLAGGKGPRPLPDRAGGTEMPVPGHPVPGPHRNRQDTVGHPVETRPQRFRDNLRRPVLGRRDLLNQTAGNTVREIVP